MRSLRRAWLFYGMLWVQSWVETLLSWELSWVETLLSWELSWVETSVSWEFYVAWRPRGRTSPICSLAHAVLRSAAGVPRVELSVSPEFPRVELSVSWELSWVETSVSWEFYVAWRPCGRTSPICSLAHAVLRSAAGVAAGRAVGFPGVSKSRTVSFLGFFAARRSRGRTSPIRGARPRARLSLPALSVRSPCGQR